MIENIRESLGADVFDDGVLLTADTGPSEENMKYLYEEKIAKHKKHRQLTRHDQRKNTAKIPASEFCFNEQALNCVCPGGYEMMYHGDHFNINNKYYHRFKSRLKSYCGCPLQCVVYDTTPRRQVSFVVKGEENKNYLDLMKQKVDSERGRKDYARRMWTIEPVFGNITSNSIVTPS